MTSNWKNDAGLASNPSPAKSKLTFPDPSTLSTIEKSKRLAAHAAVDDHFPKPAKVVGIGSGSTIVYAVEKILQLKDIEDVIFVPTGFQSRELIVQGGLRLGAISEYSILHSKRSDFARYPELDVAIDGADEVDSNLQCIKGGGACLFQEKLVAISAKKFIIVAGTQFAFLKLTLDFRKHSKLLGHTWTQGVPVEIVTLAHTKVLNDLLRLGAKTAQLRMGGKAKAGPIITDNGNFIIDADFGEISDPEGLATKIKSLVGVVEVGLFINIADAVYFGNEGYTTVRSC